MMRVSTGAAIFTDDGEELAGANIEMLDAFVGYDFDLAEYAGDCSRW
jgi:hypothetical protein